jgi:hypothetical protein
MQPALRLSFQAACARFNTPPKPCRCNQRVYVAQPTKWRNFSTHKLLKHIYSSMIQKAVSSDASCDVERPFRVDPVPQAVVKDFFKGVAPKTAIRWSDKSEQRPNPRFSRRS